VSGALAIVAFLALILLVVIPIHELGHMLVAKRFRFKVTEYFVGFGPSGGGRPNTGSRGSRPAAT
jgi:membrane-associated protease RseP (regulator of RpoE activity)